MAFGSEKIIDEKNKLSEVLTRAPASYKQIISGIDVDSTKPTDYKSIGAELDRIKPDQSSPNYKYHSELTAALKPFVDRQVNHEQHQADLDTRSKSRGTGHV